MVLDRFPHRSCKGAEQKDVFHSLVPAAKDALILRWYIPALKLETSREAVVHHSPNNDLHFLW
jgi:hypothetical protein